MDGDLDNDTRGWIMCAASAVACVFGASFIFIDLVIRLRPKWKNFQLQDSDKFLAACFSLSFGVMLLSAFLDMWPSAISELKKGEIKPRNAGLITVGCFILGFVGIQVFSRVLHSYMPSHVVDCDHTHDEAGSSSRNHSHERSHEGHDHGHGRLSRSIGPKMNGIANEDTPLLGNDFRPRSTSTRSTRLSRSRTASDHRTTHAFSHGETSSMKKSTTLGRRPSMMQLPGRVMSFIKDSPITCDENVLCKGYTDPCGQECYRHLEGKQRVPSMTRQPSFVRSTTLSHSFHGSVPSPVPEDEDDQSPHTTRHPSHAHPHNHRGHDHDEEEAYSSVDEEDEEDEEAEPHHHHVQANAFMSVGLQTSIAIGLHKLPEGFIMFATNHANPSLGFNVFFALFIHNITEGFAMALPLYLALQSRWKAIGYSCLLGGLSQPLGAGLAALWFHVAGRADRDPGHVIYGCLFAAVSGIMAAVALLLLLEGIAMNHNNPWCSAFVLVGFVIFGISTALTAS